MTIKGTVALAITLAVLVGYLAFTRPAPEPSDDLANRLMPPLTGATSVEMTEGGRTGSVVRRDGAWERSGIDDLLDAVGSLQVLGVIELAPSDPTAYGFGPDATRLRVANDTGTIADVEVGAMNPAGTGVYVRRYGEPPVLLVGALLRWELEKVRRVAFATGAP
jgi:uncharacterized protein DUF4340